MKKALPLALSLLLTLSITAAPAHAAEPSPSPLQKRIDEVLAKFPGGEQVAPNAVSWEKGAIVLELEPGDATTAARSLGSCATAAYCAWSNVNYTGSKLTFTACSSAGTLVSLAPLGPPGSAKSFANARGTGVVKIVNGPSPLYILAAGAGLPTFGSNTTHLRCFT